MFSLKTMMVGAACILFPLQLSTAAPRPPSKDLVILVHGLARSANAMWLLKYRLEEEKYDTCAINYPSMEKKEAILTTLLKNEIQRCLKSNASAKSIHFVTHSMGGPLVRHFLAHHSLKNLGRVVMLSPPNKGSDLLEYFQRETAQKFLGSMAGNLTNAQSSWLKTLPAPAYDVGIIAGTFTFNPLAAHLLKGKDDGAVSVEDMKIDGMKDFTEVTATHITIRYSKAAFIHTLNFIRSGRFS